MKKKNARFNDRLGSSRFSSRGMWKQQKIQLMTRMVGKLRPLPSSTTKPTGKPMENGMNT